jgi:hypothetical protein
MVKNASGQGTSNNAIIEPAPQVFSHRQRGVYFKGRENNPSMAPPITIKISPITVVVACIAVPFLAAVSHQQVHHRLSLSVTSGS